MQIYNEEIQIQRGLINRFETIIPKRKIQFTTWYTNLIRRKWGIYTLSYKYAGGRKTLGADAIVPFFDPGFLSILNGPYLKADPRNQSGYYGVDPVYIPRNFLFVKLPIALVIVLISYFIHPLLLYPALLVPVYFYFHNYFFVRNFKIYLSEDFFLIKKGIWGRRYILVRWEKIQKVMLRQTPYQQRNSYAHLYLHTAADSLVIPYLPFSLALQLTEYSLYKSEESRIFLF